MSDKVLRIMPESAEGLEVLQEWQTADGAVKQEMENSDALAKALTPFSDNLPYDRNRLIQETKICLVMDIQLRHEIGRRLILLRENEGGQTFGHILDEHFPGLSRSAAKNYIKFSRIAQTLPKFQAFANGRDNWSKALTIMESVSEGDLEDFEADGSVLGIPVDELDKMSVRELKGRIKKLEKDKDEVVAQVTQPLIKSVQELEDKIKLLEAEKHDLTAGDAFDFAQKAQKKIMDAFLMLMKVPRELIAREPSLRDALLGTCGLVMRVVENFEVVVLEAGQVEKEA